MTLRAVLSFVGLQLGWFACVLGAARGYPWLGPAFVLAMLARHVRAQAPGDRMKEVTVLGLAAALGLVIDSAFLRAGVLTLPGAAVAPAWLVALWPNFAAATAPGESLSRLAQRPVLAALMGGLLAPLAYEAGAGFGAVGLHADHLVAFIAIGATWCCVLPATFALRAHLARPGSAAAPPST